MKKKTNEQQLEICDPPFVILPQLSDCWTLGGLLQFVKIYSLIYFPNISLQHIDKNIFCQESYEGEWTSSPVVTHGNVCVTLSHMSQCVHLTTWCDVNMCSGMSQMKRRYVMIRDEERKQNLMFVIGQLSNLLISYWLLLTLWWSLFMFMSIV